MKLTIYTPINGKYEMLDLVYQSLLNQSNQNFEWLIVDYNETDFTKGYFDKYKLEAKLRVSYFHRPSKGRFLATKFAMENAATPYLVGVDGIYTLTPNAVEVLLNEWEAIEASEKRDEIAEIRARAVDQSGKFIGKSGFDYNAVNQHIDANWHTMVLGKKNYSEMLASWNRRLFLKAVDFNHFTLFNGKYTELATGLFWSAIGRKYLTRYLSVALKVRAVSEEKPQLVAENPYNEVIYHYYMLKDNLRYFWINPTYFLRTAIRLIKGMYKVWLGN